MQLAPGDSLGDWEDDFNQDSLSSRSHSESSHRADAQEIPSDKVVGCSESGSEGKDMDAETSTAPFPSTSMLSEGEDCNILGLESWRF